MSRDLRNYARRTNRGMVIGFLILLFGVGITLVGIIYGPAAAVFGLICMLAGFAPIVLIWLALTIMSWIVSRSGSQEPEDIHNSNGDLM